MTEFDLPDINLLNEEEFQLKASSIIVEAGTNIPARAKAITEVCHMLSKIDDSMMVEEYIVALSKAHKIKVTEFRGCYNRLMKDLEGTITKEKPTYIHPADAEDDLETAQKMGFFRMKNCYYVIGKDGSNKATNFLIKPLFHIYSKQDNKRLFEVENTFGYKKIVDIPSRDFISVEKFKGRVIEEGNYIVFCATYHFLKILSTLMEDFPLCNELRTLGWQREGFYSFANGIFNEQWQPSSDYGICEHKEHKYFLPAFSKVYSGVREDDDEYENDRKFIYMKSEITFAQWAQLMQKVYGDKANIAIAFAIASIFRDCIYESYKVFPHLFLFGEKGSGKTQMGWSLSNLFYDNQSPFNLNSGTQVGFFRRLARVKNSIAWFDEYSNDVDEKRFQSLKAAYDGVGHEKGKMTKDARTEVTKVNSACCISGQYLPTRDDNALFTRSIVLNFEKKNYTPEELENYNVLKNHEKNGITSIVTEILPFRKKIEKEFAITFSEVFEEMKEDMSVRDMQFDERLLRNFCTILTPIKIINAADPSFDFGFNFKKLREQEIQAVNELSLQISSSEALATFWNMMVFMLDSGMIKSGEDFDIKNTLEVTISKNNEPVHKSFPEPRNIIFIRFEKIHPLYMSAHRQQYGKNGVDMTSLMHYVKHHRAYLGWCRKHRFANSETSCFAFKYTMDGESEPWMNLKRDHQVDDPAGTTELPTPTAKQDKLPF